MAARWALVCYPAVLLLLGILLAASGWSLAASPGAPRPVEEVLGLAAALAGLGILAWWVAALALAVAAEGLRRRGHAAGAAIAGALTPGFMRRLASAALGANLLALPAPGHAVPAPADVRTAAPFAALPPPAPSAVLEPVHAAAFLPALMRPTPAPAAVFEPAHAGVSAEAAGGSVREVAATGDDDPHLPGTPDPMPRVNPEWVPLPAPCSPGLLAREPARQGHRSTEVVVRPGDSLWSIAAAGLGPLASDAEIAGSWPGWYSRNASVIGPDPGILHPGQVLSAPDPP